MVGIPYFQLAQDFEVASSKGKLAGHFEKHGAEFGASTSKEYLGAAKSFAAEVENFAERTVGNFVIKVDSATKRVLIGRTDTKEIRTLYKDDGRAPSAMDAAVDYAKKRIQGGESCKRRCLLARMLSLCLPNWS